MAKVYAVLVNTTTSEIIKRALYPREDMAAIEGLEEGLEWLIENITTPAPAYDGRVYRLIRNETITSTPHPTYPAINQLQVDYVLELRTPEELEQAVKDAEFSANDALLPQADLLKYTILAVGSLIKQIQGGTPSAAEETVRTKFLNLAVKVWQNDTELQSKIVDAQAGTDPSIDTGWA